MTTSTRKAAPLARTKTSPIRLDHRCDAAREERYTADGPSGPVEIARCTRCGVHASRAVGTNDTATVSAPMLAGSGSEPIGPEDALGPGPKRGDYSDRLGETLAHESGTRQNARATQRGDTPGRKGGVDTTEVAR